MCSLDAHEWRNEINEEKERFDKYNALTPVPRSSIPMGYFIFLVRIGQFPENGQRQMAYIIYLIERQMAYIIYLIEVSGNKYQKATVLKRVLQWQ